MNSELKTVSETINDYILYIITNLLFCSISAFIQVIY